MHWSLRHNDRTAHIGRYVNYNLLPLRQGKEESDGREEESTLQARTTAMVRLRDLAQPVGVAWPDSGCAKLAARRLLSLTHSD